MQVSGSMAIIVTVFLSCALAAFGTKEPGDFNAAEFGTSYLFRPGESQPVYAPEAADGRSDTIVDVPAGGSIQIEWRHPRDVYAVSVFCQEPVPSSSDVRIEYWYRIWPDGGEGGWLKLDDPFNGKFVRADVRTSSSKSGVLTFRMSPLDTRENPSVKKTGMQWRTTYKIRITFASRARISEIACFTDSVWKQAKVKIELPGRTWGGKVEGRNARVINVSRPDDSSAVVSLRYADNPNRLSADRGHIVVRMEGRGTDFSFFVDDVLREGKIRVRDIEALISDAEGGGSGISAAGKEGDNDVWDATIMEKVASLPEQTFERAMQEVSRKWIDHAHLGLPVLRQEVSIDGFSQIYISSKALRGKGADVERSYRFPEEWSERRHVMVTREPHLGPTGPKRIKRWLEEGYLPIIHSTWEESGIAYHQTVLAAALDPEVLRMSLAKPQAPPSPMGKDKRAADWGIGLRGDEPIALLSRLEIANPESTRKTATIWFKPTPMEPMSISPEGLLILSKPTRPPAGAHLTPTWGQIDIRGRGELVYLKDYVQQPDKPEGKRDLIRYSIELGPGEKHVVYVKVPYIEQLTPVELSQLKALDWETTYPEVVSLWKKRLASAIEDYWVPEPMLVNLYRTNLWHVLIGTDRDPSTGLYEHGAATYAYPMYANEAMMVARSLEMRGEHEEARRLYEPYLFSQGARGLPGNFKSKDGVLYAAAPPEFDEYTAQGYNMHHGFILWAAAEHYFWTRDRKYLEAIAPNLIAACDWITRERRATMVMNPDGSRPVEYGLAPAGDLEDVEEYLYYYATNAYYYLGMKTAADALAEIGHPEAARLKADAAAYAQDIMVSVRESVATSPVVRLLDGTYVPYVPPRAYALTDRKEGWIREALYCALHLVDAGLIAPDDQLATWILQVLEDRIFLSEESGPGHGRIKDLKTEYFSLGGYNPQPNLLDNSIAYLKRGQIKNFIRAFFNIFSASIYPDVICFSECVPPFAAGGGPVYKTPDESKFIQYMRQMLILEMGSDLYIGRGIPEAWMQDGKKVVLKNAPTYFGPASLEIRSSAAQGVIEVKLSLPTRNPARNVFVCLHHPEAKLLKSVLVNGREWRDFEPRSGEVRIPGNLKAVSITARY